MSCHNFCDMMQLAKCSSNTLKELNYCRTTAVNQNCSIEVFQFSYITKRHRNQCFNKGIFLF